MVLSDLPPHKKDELKIKVTVSVDAENILTVSAEDMATGKAITATVTSRDTEAE